MNSGAEAVETAIKTARKWGYQVKGVAPSRAHVIVAAGNFHGRTVTIVSFSTDPEARDDFGPYTPRLHGGALRRRRVVARRDHRLHRGLPRRADPGRGRRDRPADGLPARRQGGVHGAQRVVHRRRDPVGHGANRQDIRRGVGGRRSRHVRDGQGARRRDLPRVSRRGGRRRARRLQAG